MEPQEQMVSYSQNYEDVVLSRVVAGPEPGFYVDVGATDPRRHSNTKTFYDRGWRGLNLEPNARQCAPELAESLYADSPGPKEIRWLDAKQHIDLYDVEPYVKHAADAAATFLHHHLGGAQGGKLQS